MDPEIVNSRIQRLHSNITIMYTTFFSDALELPAVFDYPASRYRHHANRVRLELVIVIGTLIPVIPNIIYRYSVHYLMELMRLCTVIHYIYYTYLTIWIY